MKDRFDPLVPIVGAGFLALFAWLWTTHPTIYHRALAWWIGTPFDHPFLDTQFITAGVRCWAQGVNVYDADPCDPLDRPHNYSPLFLRLTFLPTDDSALPWLGVGLVAAFLVAVGFLPRLHRLSDRLWLLLAVLSPSAAFAAERGNLDLAIFVLLVGAGWCLGGRWPARFVGYATIMVAGLLKFYPLVLLSLLLRERWKAFLAGGLAAAASLAAFITAYRSELPLMAAKIPTRFGPGEGWGARNLSLGLNGLLPDPIAAGGLVQWAMFAVLLVGAAIGMLRVARRTDVVAALAELPEPAYRYLLIGALLLCSCFIALDNQYYRTILILPVLPAILAMAGAGSPTGARTLFRWTSAGLLVAMWQLPFRRIVSGIFGGFCLPVSGPAPNYVAWILLELIWWFLFAVFGGILLRFIRDRLPMLLLGF